MKKILSLVALLSITLSLFPIDVLAQENQPLDISPDVSLVSSESGSVIPEVDPLVNNYTWQDAAINSLSSENTITSAVLKKKVSLRNFYRKDLKAEEEPTVVIDNAKIDEITLKIFDYYGSTINVSTEVLSEQNPVVIKIKPSNEFKPGRYRVTVTDNENNTYTEEFNWGVLAINTNKSLYGKGEQVSVQMAVLDQTGEMVCNSNVNLKIIFPDLSTKVLSTGTGEIVVNPQCYTKDFTLIPDYQTSFIADEIGIYKFELTATTPEGNYSVNDAIEVREGVPFDIERKTATRIYPPNMYPVTFDITANEDFEGEIQEYVPASFNISKAQAEDNAITFDSIKTNSNSSDQNTVLGASVFNIGKPFDGDYQITLGFGGQHRDPNVGTKYTEFGVLGHDGVDFGLPMQTKVLATDDGEVVRAGDGDYGTTIVIEHSWGKSYYGHLDKVIKTVGEKVEKGDIIALSGQSGLSSGPHLHFGIKLNNNDFNNGFYGKINPLPFLGIADEGEKHGMVAGVSTSTQEELKQGIQILSWKVNLKKGDKVTLGYRFNAPLISPELYLLGPLSFINSNTTQFSETRKWQIAADAVVVNGGIVSSEAQFGGLQRKVAFVNSNWYAFYNDGTDVFYKKSADGITWGSAVDVDATDADNYNPSIDFSGNIIHVFWLDDSLDRVEGKQLDTATDTLGTLCGLTSPGAFAVSTYMASVASFSTTDALIAYSDTSSGTNVDIFEVTGLNGTCTVTDVHPGNIQFGSQNSGLTASDRPVLINLDATSAFIIFQNGTDLKSAKYDATRDEFRRNNQTIASVTDSTYSVATDGTNVWVLTQNGTTGTRLYHNPQSGTSLTETLIDADTGASGDEQATELDIDCPTATNCKLVYVDALDSAGPDLVFVDCDDATCSTKGGTTVIDSDTGSSTNAPSPAIFCLTSANCKIAHGDLLGGNSPDMSLIDCNDETCSAPSQGDINADLGGNTSKPNTSLYCSGDTDCKVIFFEDDTDDLWFADCSNANCSTRDALTAFALNVNTTNSNAKNSIYCPSSTDCKVVYHNAAAGTLIFRDCDNSGCSTGTDTTIDSAVGTTAVNVPNAIDCSAGATDCKVVYADGNTNDFFFVDCDDATCSTRTTTKIDDTAGGLVSFGVDLNCPTATNCKGVYVGNTSSPEDQYFFDCDDATCTSGSVADLDNPPTRSSLDCPTSDDCKLLYYDALESGQPPVYFADCANEKCLPAWESLTAPWTSETNVLSVSLTYDSTNSDLIANIIKDASEQAYYKISDATTISWGSETAYEFTAGDLDNISSPETAAGTGLMGVLLRQGTNIEFDLLSCAGCGPTNDQLMRHGKWFSEGVEQPFTF